MPANTVYLIDTTVMSNLLRVPGRDDRAVELQKLYDTRRKLGAKFVLPITTIIETGNLIANCSGDRSAAAARFEEAIQAARILSPPWTIRDVNWDDQFLVALLAGDSTGSSMRNHLDNRTLGTGDLAILIERDIFLRETAFKDVRIWTLDKNLSAHTNT